MAQHTEASGIGPYAIARLSTFKPCFSLQTCSDAPVNVMHLLMNWSPIHTVQCRCIVQHALLSLTEAFDNGFMASTKPDHDA